MRAELDEGEEEEEEEEEVTLIKSIETLTRQAAKNKNTYSWGFDLLSHFLSHLRGLLLHGFRSPQQDICSKDLQVSVIWDRPPACSTLQRSQLRDPAWMCWDPVEK